MFVNWIIDIATACDERQNLTWDKTWHNDRHERRPLFPGNSLYSVGTAADHPNDSM